MSKGFMMKAKELDGGEDISQYLDMSTLTKNGTQTKKMNVDFPEQVIHSLDLEAKKLASQDSP